MKARSFQPQYCNLTGALASKDIEPIELELNTGSWHSIPTMYGETLMEDVGIISNVLLIPRTNIQIDILYEGKIEPIDVQDFSEIQFESYPCENPILNSESLEVVEKNHYRFQTQYPKRNIRFPSLSEAVASTKKREDIDERKKEVDPKVLRRLVCGDDLEKTLTHLYKFVDQCINGKEREDDQFYNFSEIYREFSDTKRISGDCKAISTFTAGLLNALGLRSRCLEAFVFSEKPFEIGQFGRKRSVDAWGHQLAEVYIPLAQKGVWLPVDPANGYLFEYPTEGDLYTLSNNLLPKFDDLNKTAQIRIKYF